MLAQAVARRIFADQLPGGLAIEGKRHLRTFFSLALIFFFKASLRLAGG
jgi:hypothetical protein